MGAPKRVPDTVPPPGALRPFRLDQEVKVFRHQDPTDQQKARLLPMFPENLDEHEAEAVTVNEFQATIHTGSDKL